MSKRVRGTILGGIPADSPLWLVEDEQEEDNEEVSTVDGDNQNETREHGVAQDKKPVSSASKPTASSSCAGNNAAQEDEGSRGPPADDAGRAALGLPSSRGGGGQSESKASGAKEVVAGENAEAKLRQRLLAAMGKSKGKKRGRS